MTDFDPRTSIQQNPQTSSASSSSSKTSRDGTSLSRDGANNQLGRRNPIYRVAYRYFFENYGSSRYGTAGKYRNNTVAGVIAATAGGAYVVPALQHRSDPAELIICLVFVIGGLFAVLHNGPEWGKYARLARNFATGAVQGGLKTQTGDALAACQSVDDIPELFAAVYPWC